MSVTGDDWTASEADVEAVLMTCSQVQHLQGESVRNEAAMPGDAGPGVCACVTQTFRGIRADVTILARRYVVHGPLPRLRRLLELHHASSRRRDVGKQQVHTLISQQSASCVPDFRPWSGAQELVSGFDIKAYIKFRDVAFSLFNAATSHIGLYTIWPEPRLLTSTETRWLAHQASHPASRSTSWRS
jgi:hypothetical protein